MPAGRETAAVVIAADGIRSVARPLLVDDEPVSSSYVAYRGAVPAAQVEALGVSMRDVVVYVGPKCHFVQYPLRGGDMFNQVAVFESPKALAGEEDWGTPDELDAAFAETCEEVRAGLPLMWRDRWWRMFDREPIPTWVTGRIALSGDSAHAPLQYLAQGAVMAMEDAYVLSEHVGSQLAAGRPRAPSTGTRPSPPTTRCAPSTAGGCSRPPAHGASSGTTSATSGSGATRSCARATSTTTRSSTGSTAPPP